MASQAFRRFRVARMDSNLVSSVLNSSTGFASNSASHLPHPSPNAWGANIVASLRNGIQAATQFSSTIGSHGSFIPRQSIIAPSPHCLGTSTNLPNQIAVEQPYGHGHVDILRHLHGSIYASPPPDRGLVPNHMFLASQAAQSHYLHNHGITQPFLSALHPNNTSQPFFGYTQHPPEASLVHDQPRLNYVDPRNPFNMQGYQQAFNTDGVQHAIPTTEMAGNHVPQGNNVRNIPVPTTAGSKRKRQAKGPSSYTRRSGGILQLMRGMRTFFRGTEDNPIIWNFPPAFSAAGHSMRMQGIYIVGLPDKTDLDKEIL